MRKILLSEYWLVFCWATCNADKETSVPQIWRSGICADKEIEIHPDPIPTSAMQRREGFVHNQVRAFSTNNSVSGLGIKTEGLTIKSSPKKDQ